MRSYIEIIVKWFYLSQPPFYEWIRRANLILFFLDLQTFVNMECSSVSRGIQKNLEEYAENRFFASFVAHILSKKSFSACAP